MKYARVNQQGVPTAYYESKIHGDNIPDGAIPISEEQWRECVGNPGRRRITADGEGNATVELHTPTPRTKSLEEVKAEKQREINAACSDELNRLQSGYPQGEVVSWDKQEREARAYLADNSASVPFISAMASERGQTVGELANRIIAKADAFAASAAVLIGKRHRLEDEIGECATKADVKAIVW